ncbi:MAG: hypothetical protein VB012_00460 [Erysipelotrichaceae bacterium]|nr:hypothetical protein [Erysipelotrichaceae bacterium]
MKKKFYMFVMILIMLLFPSLSFFGNLLAVSVGENQTYASNNNVFYNLKKESTEVLFLGSSAIGYGVSPITLWHETGVSSVLRWTGYQNPMIMYYYLLDSLQYQSPKVVVLDAKTLTFKVNDFNYSLEPYLRSAIDLLPMSEIKKEAIETIADLTDNHLYTKLSYYVKFLRYNGNISNLAYVEDLYNYVYGNYRINEYDLGSASSTNLKSADYTDIILEDAISNYDYDKLSYDYFVKTIEYCQKSNIDVLIVSFPSEDWDTSKHELVKNISDEYGIDYLDYNVKVNLDRLNLDFSSDFHDTLHLNVYGKTKLTKDLAHYLAANYDLSDLRNSDEYAVWNSWYDEFAAKYSLQ